MPDFSNGRIHMSAVAGISGDSECISSWKKHPLCDKIILFERGIKQIVKKSRLED